MHYNFEQSKAISHGTGPMLVIAGPGSGKTLVITHRIRNLILEHKVKPENILVITFTKAAAIEMQYRFCYLTSDLNKSFPVNFGTCHAIFFQIIRDATALNGNCIIRECEKRDLIEEILTNSKEKDRFTLEPTNEVIQKLLSEISKVKNLGIAVNEYECSFCSKEEFIYIYDNYLKECENINKLDFDDMQLKCLKLLKSNKTLLEKYQNAFQFILVDEFQDINPVQYEIIKLLGENKNIFVVGDDDQSIYGFRGATPNIMKKFLEDFETANKVSLITNYRSSKKIVEASKNLISKNEDRFIKHPKSCSEDEGDVKFYSYENRLLQYESVCDCIEAYMREDNRKYEDIAILYRTNGHAGFLINELTKRGIPFSCKEKIVNIYDTETAKDIIAYISFALDERDIKAFYRIMNRPSRYIKRKLVPQKVFTKEELLRLQENENVIHKILQLYSQIEFIRQMEPFPAINYIRKGIGYDGFVEANAVAQNMDVSSSIEILDEIQDTSKNFKTLKEWLNFAVNYEKTIEKGYESRNGVVISTMHGAKGLEWPVVIIPDANEGFVPHKKAVTKHDLEEERRIFYVAMTRAKKYLFFFFVKTKTADLKGRPSRFLSDCLD